ncbi:dihydrofolate reductase [Chelatococcus reniformis]|uniref:Dihydrofolate reductase n=1 Tax=Chelatococcus reniformis TaxID=1494448 RepID=A0A916UR30_9HYPH|nr:dihydrofolate reductase [Chelatococcus reniformis]GGC84149.1 dihydrofolate reductase [Chelatococcus reniformis]
MALPLVLVVAVADNGAIGRDNRLIWRLRTDMQRFKALTMGRPLLMGRLTYESIGRPLPGRETVVLSTGAFCEAPGVAVAGSLADAIGRCEAAADRLGAGEIVVVGGARVYAETLPLARRIHLTEVHASPPATVFFPDWAGGAFRRSYRETFRQHHAAGPGDEYPFTFVDLERVPDRTVAGSA